MTDEIQRTTFRDPLIQILKDATALGDDEFSREAIGVDRHSSQKILTA